ncbi:hypothetical protein L6R52_03595 [Myxococcota bacterium]|nr:hypothetical protein [Myxococcota bacterium]
MRSVKDTRDATRDVALVAIVAALAAGCVAPRAAVPPLVPLADDAGVIAIYVDPKLDVSGYWARHSLGRQLARALRVELEGALVRAGFDVTRPEPDLIARISASLSGSTTDLASTTVLELSRHGKIVDRFEVATPGDAGELSAELYPELVAVTLANAIARAPSIAALGLDTTTSTTPPRERGPRASVVALFDIVDAASELERDVRTQLSEYAAARIAQTMGYRLVPREELRERLSAQKAESYRTCFDQACQIELGKALAAEKSLATKLIRIGETCALIATVFDLETETAELSASVKTRCQQSSLLEGLDELVGELHRQELLGPTGRGRAPRGAIGRRDPSPEPGSITR